MSTGHHHHAAAQRTNLAHQRELEHLLVDPKFVAAVSAYDRDDCDHDVPYVGGSGTDWRTIYWDRHFCAAIANRQFILPSIGPIDPRKTGKVHEAIEGALIHLFGADYALAHLIADVAENHAVAHMRWPLAEYRKAWAPFIKDEDHEEITNPPANLLLVPYKGTPLYAKLAAYQNGGQQRGEGAKLSKQSVNYRPGNTPHRCGIIQVCDMYRNRQCTLVAGPINPKYVCDRWEAAKPRQAFREDSAHAQTQH